MTDLDLTRRQISAMVDEIAELQRSLGPDVADPHDREALDIVRRIERLVRRQEVA